MRTSPPTPARAIDRGSDPPSSPSFPFKVLAALSFFRGRCFPAKYGRCNQRTVNRTVYRTGYSRRIYTGHHLHRPARPAPATCATHCNPKPTIRSPSVTASAYQCPPPHPTPLDQPRSGRFRRRCRGACSGLAAARRHVGRRRRLRRFGRGERLAGRRVRGNPVACKRREIPSRGNYDHQPPPPLPTPTNTTPSITNAATTIPTTNTHTMSSDARPRVHTMAMRKRSSIGARVPRGAAAMRDCGASLAPPPPRSSTSCTDEHAIPHARPAQIPARASAPPRPALPRLAALAVVLYVSLLV